MGFKSSRKPKTIVSKLRLFVILSAVGCSSNLSRERELEKSLDAFPKTTATTYDFAHQLLIDSKISPEFISLIEKKYKREIKSDAERDKIIQMNVFGFLNPGDYSKHFSPKAVKSIQSFIKKYRKSLQSAEDRFQVPKEVIASLLWVETRHGKMVGTFRMPAVFFSLLQASHPQVGKATLTELNYRKPSSNSSAASLSSTEINRKVIGKMLTKSSWALEQIKAMEKIYTNKNRSDQYGISKNGNSQFIINSPSSFAGAFGCSQFIPSSYEKYAVSSSSDQNPNLFNLKDCIYSVGNFLQKSGWNQNDLKSQSNALFEYNRIRDYGDVILRLASAAKSTS